MFKKAQLTKVILIQMGHVSLAYIDYPIDILLIVKYFVKPATHHLAVLTLSLTVLPNLAFACLSTLFNMKQRLPADLLVVLALLFVINLETFVCALVYIGLSWKKTKLVGRNSDEIECELNSTFYNQIVSALFRAFFDNFLLSLIIACSEFKFYSVKLSGLELAKIGISAIKLAIYASAWWYHFASHEFKLNTGVFKFVTLKFLTSFSFLITRFCFLIFLFTSDRKFIFICLFAIKYLGDFVYLVMYFTTSTKLNSLIMFWSFFISMLQQLVYVGDYFEFFSNMFECVLVYIYLNVYETKFAPKYFLIFSICLLVLLASLVAELVYFKLMLSSSANSDRETFLSMFYKWIVKQSKQQTLTSPNDINESFNLVL